MQAKKLVASGEAGKYEIERQRNMQISSVRDVLSKKLGCLPADFQLYLGQRELWSNDLIEDLGRDISDDILHITYKMYDKETILVEIGNDTYSMQIRKVKQVGELRRYISRRYMLPYETIKVFKDNELLKDNRSWRSTHRVKIENASPVDLIFDGVKQSRVVYNDLTIDELSWCLEPGRDWNMIRVNGKIRKGHQKIVEFACPDKTCVVEFTGARPWKNEMTNCVISQYEKDRKRTSVRLRTMVNMDMKVSQLRSFAAHSLGCSSAGDIHVTIYKEITRVNQEDDKRVRDIMVDKTVKIEVTSNPMRVTFYRKGAEYYTLENVNGMWHLFHLKHVLWNATKDKTDAIPRYQMQFNINGDIFDDWSFVIVAGIFNGSCIEISATQKGICRRSCITADGVEHTIDLFADICVKDIPLMTGDPKTYKQNNRIVSPLVNIKRVTRVPQLYIDFGDPVLTVICKYPGGIAKELLIQVNVETKGADIIRDVLSELKEFGMNCQHVLIEQQKTDANQCADVIVEREDFFMRKLFDITNNKYLPNKILLKLEWQKEKVTFCFTNSKKTYQRVFEHSIVEFKVKDFENELAEWLKTSRSIQVTDKNGFLLQAEAELRPENTYYCHVSSTETYTIVPCPNGAEIDKRHSIVLTVTEKTCITNLREHIYTMYGWRCDRSHFMQSKTALNNDDLLIDIDATIPIELHYRMKSKCQYSFVLGQRAISEQIDISTTVKQSKDQLCSKFSEGSICNPNVFMILSLYGELNDNAKWSDLCIPPDSVMRVQKHPTVDITVTFNRTTKKYSMRAHERFSDLIDFVKSKETEQREDTEYIILDGETPDHRNNEISIDAILKYYHNKHVTMVPTKKEYYFISCGAERVCAVVEYPATVAKARLALGNKWGHKHPVRFMVGERELSDSEMLDDIKGDITLKLLRRVNFHYMHIIYPMDVDCDWTAGIVLEKLKGLCGCSNPALLSGGLELHDDFDLYELMADDYVFPEDMLVEEKQKAMKPKTSRNKIEQPPDEKPKKLYTITNMTNIIPRSKEIALDEHISFLEVETLIRKIWTNMPINVQFMEATTSFDLRRIIPKHRLVGEVVWEGKEIVVVTTADAIENESDSDINDASETVIDMIMRTLSTTTKENKQEVSTDDSDSISESETEDEGDVSYNFSVPQRKESFSMQFAPGTKIKQGKEQLAERLGVSAGDITLMASGRDLKDNYIMDRIGITPRKNIIVYIREMEEILLVTGKGR